MNYYTIKMTSKSEYIVSADTLKIIFESENNLVAFVDSNNKSCMLNKAHFVDAFLNEDTTEKMNKEKKSYLPTEVNGEIVMVEKIERELTL